jgi:predicted Zn-dependent peptidase
VRFSGLATDPDKTLELLSDELRHPAYRKADFELFKTAWEQNIHTNLQRGAIARYLGQSLTYGQSHPYALSPGGLGTYASIQQITVEKSSDLSAQVDPAR